MLRFKFGPVVPTGVEQLSHATCSGATGDHAMQGGWVVTCAAAVDVTQSRQTPCRD
jgi:hypothetical protein